MKKIDNFTNDELADYIKRVYEEPGPYQIDSWFLYQLNHTPSDKEIEKADKILKKMEFNEHYEYIITLRATATHIRNFTLNMIRKIETNLSEFDEVFTEIKQEIDNGQDPIS
jgi:hypothetical protein